MILSDKASLLGLVEMIRGVSSCCLLMIMGAHSLTGQSVPFKLQAQGGQKDDMFGSCVAKSGDYVIVGARQDDDKGSAYIFKREDDGWRQHARLRAKDRASGDLFGALVSIDGVYAIVSAVEADRRGDNSGVAYVFKREDEKWIQDAELMASDGVAGDYFGNSVAIDSHYAFVGAVGDDDKGIDSGCVYVFKRDGNDWIQQTKITARDGSAGDIFGNAVAISDAYAVVGAIGDDDNGENSGSAYIFKQIGDEWVEQLKLTANDGSAGARFGNATALFDECVIVGARLDAGHGENSGAAYIFERQGETWQQLGKLTAGSDEYPGYVFGNSVAINESFALVGAPGAFGGAGAVFVFKEASKQWRMEGVVSPGVRRNDYFGISVAADGDDITVGATRSDGRGFAFLYDEFFNHVAKFTNKISHDEGHIVRYDEPPAPIGGFAEIQRSLIYPISERRVGIQGRVVVQILVDEDGRIEETRILKSLTPNCDRAAVNAIKSAKWKPAVKDRKPVKVWIAIPIKFRIR